MRALSLAAAAALLLTGCSDSCGGWAPWRSDMCLSTTCAVELGVALNGALSAEVGPGESVIVEVTATNHTDAALTLWEPCPEGFAVLTGLPDGADPYGTCLAGACADSPVPIELAPGETATVTATLTVDGDDCNDPLDPGEYAIGVDFDSQPQATPLQRCGTDEAILVVR